MRTFGLREPSSIYNIFFNLIRASVIRTHAAGKTLWKYVGEYSMPLTNHFASHSIYGPELSVGATAGLKGGPNKCAISIELNVRVRISCQSSSSSGGCWLSWTTRSWPVGSSGDMTIPVLRESTVDIAPSWELESSIHDEKSWLGWALDNKRINNSIDGGAKGVDLHVVLSSERCHQNQYTHQLQPNPTEWQFHQSKIVGKRWIRNASGIVYVLTKVRGNRNES